MGWLCVLWWGSEVSPGMDAARMGRWLGIRSGSQTHGSRIPELEGGHKDVSVASGVKGVQATFSRFLGTGSLRRTPARLPALIDP